MIRRAIFGMSGLTGRTHVSFRPATMSGHTIANYLIISRPLFLFLDGNDSEADREEEVNTFAMHADMMGGDEFPSFRKEKPKKNELRTFHKNRTQGKRANSKVKGLVQLINLRKFYKFQH
mmetsp:Transcript_33153/g.68437  ORF Transcript_33153/g.68437 Transcript_33153/m.68437 type:complete len:120 (+) Transcript_33153:56-415(+)